MKYEERLARARDYVQSHGTQADKPQFHMTSPTGWFNDPNGLSLYGGEIHLFYQHYPYGPHWGDMHWGHCKTRDFIRWEQLPVALAPDMPYDKDGCFSGGAVAHDGQHILMYTGVVHGEGGTQQAQCVAIGDGMNYAKSPANPVIRPEQLPPTCNRAEFRDPKLWYDGRFYALVGSRGTDDIGQVVLFASEDALDWQFVSVLARGRQGMGRVWECPDFFELDGEHVLLVSPQFMEASGTEFHNGNGTVAQIGGYDRETHQLVCQHEQAIDYGLDFYAPQTVLTEDGRRVMIGWLQSWDNNITPEGQPWSGIMSIPRVLTVLGGRLCQWPVQELDACRTDHVAHTCILQDGEVSLPSVSGRAFDMELTLQPQDCELLEIKFAMDAGHHTSLRIYPQLGHITFDRTYSGLKRDILCKRSMQVPAGEAIRLRLVMDRNTVELFVNDGAYALSALVYTEVAAQGIAFAARGTAALDIDFYRLALGE